MARPPRRGRSDAPRGTSGGSGDRVCRVFEVPAKAVYGAVNDTSRRNWAPEPGFRVVSNLAPRFVRIDLPSGGQVAFAIERQGNARCAVSLEFIGVADTNKAAAQWRDGLAALAEMLDFDWD